MQNRANHFSGDVESITAGGKVIYRARTSGDGRLGRVIRRYHTGIPIREFDKWQDLLRKRARGCGLYALYSKKLIYVGLATNGIRARIRAHSRKGAIPFMNARPNSALLTDASTSPLRAQCDAAQRGR